MPGQFISFEGGEGVGKSTNLEFVRRYLTDNGIEVCMTREPGGTALGEQVRELLLDARQTSICDNTELLLMFAARAQHLEQVILPALQRGEWVVCDRFTDATYAYQGGGRGIETDRIAILEQWVQGDVRPDYTLLLDMPVEKGLKRAGERSEPDRIEQEQQAFFERVRTAYLARAEQFPERFRVVDASPALEQVQKKIKTVLDDILLSSNI